MTTYLKYKPGWMQLLIFGSLSFGIFLVTAIISMLAISNIYGIPFNDLTTQNTDHPQWVAASKASQAVLSICLFAIPALVFGYLSHEKPLAYLGFKKPIPAIMWVLSILLLLVALPWVSWVSEMNHHMHLPKSMAAIEKMLRDAETTTSALLKKMLDMRSLGDLFQMIFIIAVIPAFAEELFFRGVLQRIFIGITKRPWIGVLITAFIFSAIHGQFLGFFPRFILGALLGFMYWYSGSLWPGILAHFLNNAVQLIAVYRNPEFADKEMHFPFLLISGSAFLTMGVLYLIHKRSLSSFAETYDTDDDLPIGFNPKQ